MNLAGAPRRPEIATMPALSEWLQLMLAEISRKRDDAERAREEEAERSRDVGSVPMISTPLPPLASAESSRHDGAERARNETAKPR